MIRLVNDDMRKLKTKQRLDKALAHGEANKQYCLEACRDNLGTLSGKPHPVPSMASQGMTLGDYANWMLDHGNYSGLAATLRRELEP